MMMVQTKSQTTVNSYEFLEKNKDKSFTLKQIAEAQGLRTNQVTGSVVSLEKKGILTKSEVVVEGKPYKSYQWALPAEFSFVEVKAMSDKAVQILQFLQANPNADFTANDIAAELDFIPIAVNGVVNGLVKKGYVVRQESEAELPDKTIKTLKFIVMTEEGKNYKF